MSQSEENMEQIPGMYTGKCEYMLYIITSILTSHGQFSFLFSVKHWIRAMTESCD